MIPCVNLVEIGGRIRALREHHKLDQAALAKLCDVHKESIRLWELGKSLTFKAIETLAEVFTKQYKDKDVEHLLLFGERRTEKKRIPADALRPHVAALKERLVALEAMCGPAVPSRVVRKAGFSAKGKRKPQHVAEER